MRGENWSIWGKTSQSRVENQQLQPTYDGECGNRTRAALPTNRTEAFQNHQYRTNQNHQRDKTIKDRTARVHAVH